MFFCVWWVVNLGWYADCGMGVFMIGDLFVICFSLIVLVGLFGWLDLLA